MDLTNVFEWLTDANLFAGNLSFANLNNTHLEGAILSYAENLGQTTGSPSYNAETDFMYAYSGAYGNSPLFDPVEAGWTFVPEPNGMLLGIAALSCVGFLARRRAH